LVVLLLGEEQLTPVCNAVRASFSVAWKIARTKALHATGESLVKPTSVEMTRIICGDAIADK